MSAEIVRQSVDVKHDEDSDMMSPEHVHAMDYLDVNILVQYDVMLTFRILLASLTLSALKFETPTACVMPDLCARASPSTNQFVAQLFTMGKPGQ